jgi:diguanylate cyclase (GGDEF)-like protein
MAKSIEALQAELKALRETYIAQLPRKFEQLEECWNSLRENPSDLNQLKNLHLLVHRLTGSGATYGFSALSEEARTLELYLKPLLDNGQAPTEAQQAIIRTLLNVLKEAAFEPDYSVERERFRIISHDQITEEEGKLIFLVDDDVEQAQSLALQINHFGYNVKVFYNLDQFKSALQQTVPAAIIMDVVFPDGNQAGIETVMHFQKEHENSIPVAFISSRSDLTTRLQAVRAGGNAYFIKPVDLSALIDKLDLMTAYQIPEPYRILIVDDDPTLAAFYSLTLQQAGMKTYVVNDPLQVMQPIVDFVPDLILMDVYMPECTGKELAKVIRQQEAYVSIPIVFLSSETDLSEQLDAMHRGGDDFLTKPIEPEFLISSVTARAQRSRILSSFVTRDSLTGLLNHTKTKEQLDLEVARATRRKGQLVFAMLDIDHFKAVNDTYGHPAGDRVIKSLARLLQQRLRKTDIIGRYGGEEFALILLDTDGPSAARVMEQIRQRFSQIKQHSAGLEFTVTFSCGLATFPTYPDSTILNDAADKALYHAKHQGRNRVVLAD